MSYYLRPKYCAPFIDDFSEMLSIICADFNYFILTGDNIDKELCALFDTFES